MAETATKKKRPKYGGRAAGTPNKRTAMREVEVREAVDAAIKNAPASMTPREAMLWVMGRFLAKIAKLQRQEETDERERKIDGLSELVLRAAEKAAPFVHPRLSAVHVMEERKEIPEKLIVEFRVGERVVERYEDGEPIDLKVIEHEGDQR